MGIRASGERDMLGLDAGPSEDGAFCSQLLRGLVARGLAGAQPAAAMIHTVFAQPDAGSTQARSRRVQEQFAARFPRLAVLLDEAEADVSAYLGFAPRHWRCIWGNNPLKRLNRGVKRRSNMVDVLPRTQLVIRLVGMLLAKQHDEWRAGWRYFSAESLASRSQPPCPSGRSELTRRVWECRRVSRALRIPTPLPRKPTRGSFGLHS